VKTRRMPKKPKKGASAPQPSESIESQENWVSIQAPEGFEEMINAWLQCEEPNIGWCFMCNGPIRSADELIEGSGTHDCDAGRGLEKEIQATGEAQRREPAPPRPSTPRKRRKRSG
jgi:hypothetical protein